MVVIFREKATLFPPRAPRTDPWFWAVVVTLMGMWLLGYTAVH